MVKRILTVAWLLLAAGLFLAAVLLSVARVWALSLGEYRHDIETAASATLQRPVTIGGVEASWRGLHPVLRLRDVALAGAGQAQRLDMREIQVSLDTGYFLRTRKLRFTGIDIIGTSLTLARDADGRLVLEGFAGKKGSEVEFGALAAMSRLSIHDADVTLRDIPKGVGAQHFSAVNVSLANVGDHHYMSGHAVLPGQLGDRIEIVAHLRGDIAKPAAWHGRAYFKGQALSLSSLLAPVLEQTNTVRGVADLRLWAELTASRITSVSGELEVDALQLENREGDRQSVFAADNARMQFGWRQAGKGWQAVLQRLQVSRAGQEWKTGKVSLDGLPLADGIQLRAEAALLDLEEATALLQVLPRLDAGLRETLTSAQPTGRLEDLSCTVTRREGAFRVDRLSARFAGLGVLQTGALPYIAGLDGSIAGSSGAGTLHLDSDTLVVHDERLFRNALQFDRVAGELYWRTADDALQIGSASLVLANPNLALDARFNVAVPHNGDPVTTDTAIAVHEFDVASTGKYLPARIMSPHGVAWLDRSLTGGKVHDGSVVISGRLDHLPFDHGEGRLEVRLPVRDATLDFNEQWSPVTQLDAEVDFTGRQMDIRSQRGFIRTAALQDVHAQIKNLAKPELTLEGKVEGALPVMLAELGSSPLGEAYGGFVDRVDSAGRAELALDIRLPLAQHERPLSVSGGIRLRDDTLKVSGTDIVLEHIRGRLAFDGNGIRGDGIKAGLFGKTAAARVWTEPGKAFTHISLDGKLALLDRVLAKASPLRDVISGEPDWHVQLTARGKPARGKTADLGLQITSTLAGLAIDLPAPLGKTAAEQRALSVEIAALDSSERYVHITYADDLQGVLVLTQGAQGVELQRGNIALGGDAPEPPQIPQLLISGRLDHVRLADWKPHLAAGGQRGTGPPLRVSLRIADLEVLGYRLHDTGIDIVQTSQALTIKTLGPSAEGELQLMLDGDRIERITMDMQRLVLEPVGEASERSRPPLTPADFPALQVKTQQLVYDKADFGAFELQAARQAGGGYRIERLALSSKMLSMNMSGDWRQIGEDQVSDAELTVTNGNVGMLLDALGYQKVMKRGRPGGTLKASWRGAPWDVRTEIINGSFDILIEDGQLLDVEPGATGRALGLLSLTKLPKRLTLDFTDLFGQGFGFERISGKLVLDNGNAYTDKLVIDGPAAKIEITGRVGLAAQDYDELVTVTPYLNSSLPLAGALAGGPAVGAAVIVAEKLFEDKLGLNEIARKQYAVTGPWAKPVVKLLNAPKTAAERQPDAAADADGFFQ